MNKVKFTISMDKSVYDFIKDKAQQQNRNVSNFIEQTIKTHYSKSLKKGN